MNEDAAPLLPPGATYIGDFISSEEERAITTQLDAGEWDTQLKRRVQHFGYRYDYTSRSITADAYLGALPVWLQPLTTRLVSEGYFETLPDQVIANEYLPGQGISAHVDCIPCFSDTIVSISLLSQCEMVFREKRDNRQLAHTLSPRSAVALKGEARYQWTHEIPARKTDMVHGIKVNRGRRISLTFRTVVAR